MMKQLNPISNDTVTFFYHRSIGLSREFEQEKGGLSVLLKTATLS